MSFLGSIGAFASANAREFSLNTALSAAEGVGAFFGAAYQTAVNSITGEADGFPVDSCTDLGSMEFTALAPNSQSFFTPEVAFGVAAVTATAYTTDRLVRGGYFSAKVDTRAIVSQGPATPLTAALTPTILSPALSVLSSDSRRLSVALSTPQNGGARVVGFDSVARNAATGAAQKDDRDLDPFETRDKISRTPQGNSTRLLAKNSSTASASRSRAACKKTTAKKTDRRKKDRRKTVLGTTVSVVQDDQFSPMLGRTRRGASIMTRSKLSGLGTAASKASHLGRNGAVFG